MANRITGVAKLLGVEVGEIFQVDNDDSLKSYYLRFSKIGLEFSKSKGDDTWITADYYTLFSLLRGELSIKRLPWEPAVGDWYCYSDPASPIMWGRCLWTGYGVDKHRFNHGLVFRTIEEAIALTKKLLVVAQEARNNG